MKFGNESDVRHQCEFSHANFEAINVTVDNSVSGSRLFTLQR